MDLKRLLRHLLTPAWRARARFPAAALRRIEAAIAETERLHSGQLRFAVESALELGPLLRGMSARQRALEVFASLGVWDTDANNGVLMYLLLADRDVEIIADRGIAQRVDADAWERICRRMEAAFRAGQFEAGVLAGIAEIGAELAAHFPAQGVAGNELPDAPVLL